MKKEDIINKLVTIFKGRLTYENDKLIWKNQHEITVPDNFESLFAHSDSTSNYIYTRANDTTTILLQTIDVGFIYEQTVSNGNVEICLSEKIPDELCAKIIFLLPNKTIYSVIPSIRIERNIRQGASSISIFDLIRMTFTSLAALTIKNLNQANHIDALLYAKSFIFNASMLQCKNFLIVENVEQLTDNVHHTIRRKPHEKIDIPYRKYNDEVVQYYIDANSARVPKIVFLSFYNVLEYYFDKIYIDDRCSKIQALITSPKFNHNILAHYKKILEILDIKRAKHLEKINITEKESLKLLIKNCINIDDFKFFLSNNQFYLNNNAYKIANSNFSLEDSAESIINKICNRVYGVRNALVHSKDSEDIRYIPQKDDIHIIEEIELIRYLAQEVIISTSELIK